MHYELEMYARGLGFDCWVPCMTGTGRVRCSTLEAAHAALKGSLILMRIVCVADDGSRRVVPSGEG